MDVLKAMKVFAQVAKDGSFAAAARSLDLSTSAVSRHVQELETWLGVGLLQRTTRKLSLTAEGTNYLAACREVLESVEDIRRSANEGSAEPSGTLRVTAPVFLASACIQRALPAFLKAYPLVSVELHAADRFVDLVDEGFDIALRVGDLADSSLVARGLGDVRLTIVGSPEYLRVHGTPNSPPDLEDHNCIIDRAASFGNRWPVTGHDGKGANRAVTGNVAVNNGELARDLALQDIGLALLPEFFVTRELAQRRLIEVLNGHVHSSVGLFLLYPKGRYTSAKVRAFIDFLVDVASEQHPRNR
ncbi:MAG: LysR family transcriptional regulator [Pseudomonadota bacterium]